jgi:hypothetical protein
MITRYGDLMPGTMTINYSDDGEYWWTLLAIVVERGASASDHVNVTWFCTHSSGGSSYFKEKNLRAMSIIDPGLLIFHP